MTDQIKVALAGQQNAGKSTLFNLLTGARQHVANYPGVTVDKKYGRYSFRGGSVVAVDLPGTYSLSSFSLEERVAREFLIKERPDVAINVVDASNLRRSLHLTLQLLEMGLKSVLALNMMDVAKARGLSIDVKGLAARLGLPVVETVGSRGVGRDALREAIETQAQSEAGGAIAVDYGPLEPMIAELSVAVRHLAEAWQLPARWLALKLLEQDGQLQAMMRDHLEEDALAPILTKAEEMASGFESSQDISVADHIVAMRGVYVGAVLGACVTGADNPKESLTNRIDRFVLNRWLAPLVLVLTVWLIYQISIVWGYELTNYTWPILAKFRELVAGILPSAGFP